MCKLVGIDPGLDGALVFLDEKGQPIAAYAMPTWIRKTSATEKRMIDEDKLASYLYIHQPQEAWIEDVWSSEQMGVVSSFTFGEGKGILKGVCAGLKIPRKYVHPSVWKAEMGCTADKKTSTALARRIWPLAGKMLSSVDKREAALIGLYGFLKGWKPHRAVPGQQKSGSVPSKGSGAGNGSEVGLPKSEVDPSKGQSPRVHVKLR